ncbi:MAG: hypothetical protein A2447_12405 [Omnitrophica WOR_2 bacterium RIFOXYC2_FULL_38_12]|nr:MAG: hypothetical protein A2447_12405 [Omnitrophica WOR_2 bacterium RIFOXYC2_FULL_38_12]
MNFGEFEVFENKVIIRIKNRICETSDELINSPLFLQILKLCVKELQSHNSYLLNIFEKKDIDPKDIEALIKTFQFLSKMTCDLVLKVEKDSSVFLKDKALLNEFVEYLYNYWRSFDRFIICADNENDQEKRPYRIFNNTIEQLTHLVRAIYRDIQENITGTHPRIYRQVRAGAEIASIATPRSIPFQAKEYEKLNVIPFIRQILIYPPLILNPPMNKRTGVFERVSENPLNRLSLNEKEWLCYPAKVGELIILIYFNQKFYELGYSLCNLFELAEDHELTQRPDAVYCYGVDEKDIEGLGKSKTIFYDDSNNKMFVAAVPSNNEFGYFGYLKKMVLTLHNIIMIKRGIFPFHGALLNLILPNEKTATILLIGDTGAGKSETIEAMRDLGKHEIQDMIIIADDMGSIQINADGDIIGYGTEIGAFLRLDDLKAGYAFGQIDRTIIMSPNKTNARIVLPVTTFDRVIRGHKIDLILYANNYDEIDEDHPIVEKFDSAEQALKVFREGTVMSKGTTTSTGIVHSYFANVFGPPQYKELHDQLAKKYFMEFYRKGLFVGQMRTRLGIAGYERTGPEEAAKELLKLIKGR